MKLLKGTKKNKRRNYGNHGKLRKKSKNYKRFEPRMNANKRELKEFLLPRSSQKARRKNEKEKWPWILKSNCKRFFATEGAEITEEKQKLKKIYPQICADFHRLKELKD